jgi:hypothetical protein
MLRFHQFIMIIDELNDNESKLFQDFHIPIIKLKMLLPETEI